MFFISLDGSGLDWGTLYNFRFEANAGPTDVTADLGVFEAGMPSMLMSASKGPTSSFFPVVDLDVSSAGSGGGGITSSPIGIDCGSDCNGVYAPGTSVEVSAAADPDSALIRWTEGGVPVGTDDDFTALLNADRTLVAHFELCDRTLGSETVLAAETFEACDTLTTGPSFVVQQAGQATLRAGTTVALANGLAVAANGGLTVEIDPVLLP